MRVRQSAAMATLLALAFVMTGCTKSAPEITDAQVEEWRALAAETIPAATAIDIEAGTVTTMGGGSNIVHIAASFAAFADLKANYQAVTTLDATVRDQAQGASVITTLRNEGIDTLKAEVAARLLESVPGLEHAQAGAEGTYRSGNNTPTLTVAAYVYTPDPTKINAPWLDAVATVTQEAASEVGGTIYSIGILPAANIDANLSAAEIDEALLPVGDLAGLQKLGTENGCIRTTHWAYDVTNPWAIVYPADAPGGACA